MCRAYQNPISSEENCHPIQDMERTHPAIAGREKGPGPGRYALPTTIGFIGHDFTKPTGPAFTFHSRMNHHLSTIHSNPGPQYYIDARITRFGRDGTPAYSMLGRERRSVKSLPTPGPGAYNLDRVPTSSKQKRPPSYTMGFRNRYRPVDTVPPPNKYTLPPLMGSQVPTKPASACYTIAGRCRSRGAPDSSFKTPGPGQYDSTDPSIYLPRRPAFSMLGRHSVPIDSDPKPGPGSHHPERVTVHKPRPPAFSLGIRHSEFVTPLVTDTSGHY